MIKNLASYKVMKREREGGKRRDTNSFLQNLRNSFTLFVDDLPSSIDAWWLRRMFKDFGVIIDAFIPKKTRAKSNSKFGFVRYRYRSEAVLAIEKMNGTRRHNAILKVSMAQYGRERNDSRKGDIHCKGFLQVNGSEIGDNRLSYRQVLTGEKLSSNIGVDLYHSQSEMEAIKSRVAALELEVARLKHALISAMSDGKQMNDEVEGKRGGQQSEVATGSEGGSASIGDVEFSGMRKATVYRSNMDKSSTCEGAVNVNSDGSSVVIDGSVSDDKRPAGRGDNSGEGSMSEVINEVASRIDWDSKEEVQPSPFFEADEGVIGGRKLGLDVKDSILSGSDISYVDQTVREDSPINYDRGLCNDGSIEKEDDREGSPTLTYDGSSEKEGLIAFELDTNAIDWDNSRDVCVNSENEEALEELELYRQYFDTSEERKHKDPSSVVMEGDRKGYLFANIRKRSKRQKKKEENEIEKEELRNFQMDGSEEAFRVCFLEEDF